MTRIRVLFLAALMTVVPMADAVARDLDQSRGQREEPRQRPDEREQRISLAEAERNVRAGRPGRYLNASDRGSVIVVRWAYPDGRIADITVDARSGRIIGER
jgi:uncharacterized membrane protein YkoI